MILLLMSSLGLLLDCLGTPSLFIFISQCLLQMMQKIMDFQLNLNHHLIQQNVHHTSSPYPHSFPLNFVQNIQLQSFLAWMKLSTLVEQDNSQMDHISDQIRNGSSFRSQIYSNKAGNFTIIVIMLILFRMTKSINTYQLTYFLIP